MLYDYLEKRPERAFDASMTRSVFFKYYTEITQLSGRLWDQAAVR